MQKVAFLVAVIVLWEFGFPQHAAAVELAVNPSFVRFAEQRTDQAPGRLPEIPSIPRPEAKRSIRLTVTAYSSTKDQTDGDPFTTASGQKVRDGIIAANSLPFGTRVRFPDNFGDKIFVVADRMAPKHNHMADIWMPSREQAKQWGARYVKMEIL